MANSYFNAPGFQNQFITSPFGEDPYTSSSWNTSLPFTYSGVTNTMPTAYNGPSPYQPTEQQGFWSSAYQMYSSTYREPYWGNPMYTNQPALDSVTTRPVDATVWAGQRLVAPAIAFGAAFRTLGPRTMGGYFTGQGIGGGLGKGVAQGITRTAMRAMRAPGWIGAGAEAVAGAAGSLAGAVLIPAAVGMATMKAAQTLAFDPYIRTRQTGQALRQNFEGITFGDSEGNPVTGGGLSNREAYGMASQLVRAGARDMTFNSDQYLQLADLSMRSGLLDNANSKQIVSRIKGIAEQVKVVMAISKDPDFQTAVQEIASLQLSGASATGGRYSAAANTYQNLGRYASIAGTTVQRMMNTVGNQGQSLFSSFGMTPYLGQLASANIYSSFAAAQREGLLSPSQVARMGGLENGTNSALLGLIQGGRSSLMQMGLLNQAFGRGGSQSMVGPGMSMTATIGQFGNNFARDPYGTLGRQALHGDELIARDIANNGGMGLESTLESISKVMPFKRNANGQVDAYDLVPVMMSMGMSKDEINAFMTMRASQTDPRAHRAALRAVDRTGTENMMQTISQESLYGGWLGTTYRHARQGIKGFVSDAAGAVGDAAASVLGYGDNLTSAWQHFQFGGTIGPEGIQANPTTFFDRTSNQTFNNVRFLSENSRDWKQAGGSTGQSPLDKIIGTLGGTNRTTRDFVSASKMINAAARQGDAKALAILSAQDNETRRKAGGDFFAAHKDELDEHVKRLVNPDNASQFNAFFDSFGNTQTGAFFNQTATGQGDNYKAQLRSITGQSGAFYNLHAMGAAVQAEQGLASGDLNAGNVLDFVKNQPGLFDSLGRPKDGAQAITALNKLNRKVAEGGYTSIATAAYGIDPSKIAGNSSLIRDPVIRKKYEDAKKRGDKAGMEESLAQWAAANNGGHFSDRAIKGTAGMNDSEIAKLQQNQIIDAQQRSQLEKAFKGGMIDYNNYQSTMNALDMKESTKLFSDAVEQFSQAVGGMKNGTPNTPKKLTWGQVSEDTQRTSQASGGQ